MVLPFLLCLGFLQNMVQFLPFLPFFSYTINAQGSLYKNWQNCMVPIWPTSINLHATRTICGRFFMCFSFPSICQCFSESQSLPENYFASRL